jgi:hypothetical protein
MGGRKWFRLCVDCALASCAVLAGSYYLTSYGRSVARSTAQAAAEEPIRDMPKAELGNLMCDTLNWDAHALANEMRRIACHQTALFILEKMPKVPVFADRFALFDFSLKAADPKLHGHYCEFGVATGVSINYIAAKVRGTVHGFDSFAGNPENWITGIEKGAFSTGGELPKVRENVKLYKGWFNKSLPVWAKENPGPMAFMHLDADLYSSTKDVFDILADRIVPGTVIQFDEYFNYPTWQEGEYKAFTEFVKAHHVGFEYLGYSDQQLAVRILSVASPRGGK